MNEKIYRIEKGHTLIEYRHCYGRLYDKGKILSFSKNEKYLMNPKRKYWELKDEKGRTLYYQLPRGIFRSDYNISKHVHKKPFIFAMVILLFAAAMACTSFAITNTIFKKKNIIDVADPEYSEIYEKFKRIIKEGKDPYDEMSLDEFTNACIAKFVYVTNEGKNYMTVGRASTDTSIPIISPAHVEVRNALIKNGDKAMEESDSYCNFVFAPKVGRRDYSIGDNVVTYDGEAASAEDVTFSDKVVFNRSKKEFKETTGKDVYFPFLYTISKDTVLQGDVTDTDPVTHEVHNGSKKSKDKDGNMTIYLELHNQKSVAKYAKRMKYLSGKTPQYFNYVNMTFLINKDYEIIETNINEKYDVGNEMFSLPTVGKMKTRYYTKDVIDIPSISTKFDYSKYPF